jgi:hypothetical protein
VEGKIYQHHSNSKLNKKTKNNTKLKDKKHFFYSFKINLILDGRIIITQTIYSLFIMSTPNWEIINGVRYLVNEESNIQKPSLKKDKLESLTQEEVSKWVNVPTYNPVVNSSGLTTFIPK